MTLTTNLNSEWQTQCAKRKRGWRSRTGLNNFNLARKVFHHGSLLLLKTAAAVRWPRYAAKDFQSAGRAYGVLNENFPQPRYCLSVLGKLRSFSARARPCEYYVRPVPHFPRSKAGTACAVWRLWRSPRPSLPLSQSISNRTRRRIEIEKNTVTIAVSNHNQRVNDL